MTPQQTLLVRHTLVQLGRDRAKLGSLVLERLIVLDPSLRTTFADAIKTMGGKLSGAIETAVRALDDPAPLSAALRETGARLVRAGATPAHFELFEQALLQALGRALERGFTPACRDAWSAGYRMLAAVMMAAGGNHRAA